MWHKRWMILSAALAIGVIGCGPSDETAQRPTTGDGSAEASPAAGQELAQVDVARLDPAVTPSRDTEHPRRGPGAPELLPPVFNGVGPEAAAVDPDDEIAPLKGCATQLLYGIRGYVDRMDPVVLPDAKCGDIRPGGGAEGPTGVTVEPAWRAQVGVEGVVVNLNIGEETDTLVLAYGVEYI